jgi:hypothetical protein
MPKTTSNDKVVVIDAPGPVWKITGDVNDEVTMLWRLAANAVQFHKPV